MAASAETVRHNAGAVCRRRRPTAESLISTYLKKADMRNLENCQSTKDISISTYKSHRKRLQSG